jgi:hypothetical protein
MMTDIREWANANGYTIGAKGRIPDIIQHAYDAAHPGAGGAAGPDYPDDDFDSAFAAPETPYTGPGDPPGDDDTGETPPRRPRGGKKASRPSWLPGGGKKKPGRKAPRISVEDLLGAAWRGAAKLASPLPPLQRTLRLQAPVAGLLLEDAVKGTAIDTVLQPLARLASQGKTIQALAGPPAFVTAIMAHHVQRAGMEPPQEPHPVFMALATEGLRSSLMAWMDIAGPKFDVAMAREKEFEEKYGQSVDDTIALIFGAPVDPDDGEAVMAEEEAIRRAQGVL